MENNSVPAAELSPTPAKPSVFASILKGAAHVIKVAWTVPAVQSTVATLLIRFGLPGTLVAIGMAVGEKLAQ